MAGYHEELGALAESHRELAERVTEELGTTQEAIADLREEFTVWARESEAEREKQAEEWERRLARCVLIPWSRWAVIATSVLALAAAFAGGHFLR